MSRDQFEGKFEGLALVADFRLAGEENCQNVNNQKN